MKQFACVEQWQDFRRGYRRNYPAHSVGFVPTMGALHDGHLSLVKRCQRENKLTVVSIYVNPTQFDQAADLQSYPQPLEDDLQRLRHIGADAVFAPAPGAMYPDEFRYRVSESEFSKTLCGAHRKGHFDGVLTVVMKLLNLVQPHRAYFGQKDYQQLQLIRGMTEAFFMPVEIVPCPIVREADGLAMSSRNRRLDACQRQQAASLHQALRQFRTSADARQELLAKGFDVDYVEDLDGRRLAAAALGDVRLIDNVALDLNLSAAEEIKP